MSFQEKKVKAQDRYVETVHIKGFFWTLSVCLVSYIIASLINQYHPLSQRSIDYIGILGLMFDGTALYGFVGAAIQTLKGKSEPEQIDQNFLHRTITLGLICWFLTYLLTPVA